MSAGRAAAPGTFWREKRVLVTGATGMIGSWLARDLADAGAVVVALVCDPDPQSELYRSRTVDRLGVVLGRLEDYETVERAINEHEIDTVFHLGAQTIVGTAHRSPLPTFEANVRGTWNVLEACRRLAPLVERIVVASSDKAYGDATELPYHEDMPLRGAHPYDVSKSCTDLIAHSYHRTYGMPVAIARCGNVFGGGDLNWSRIVPGAMRALLHDERPVIRSDGTYVRDYLYVRDAVEAFCRLAEASTQPGIAGEAFNFSTESPVTVLDMYDEILLAAGAGRMEPVILSHAVGEIRNQHLSAAKARERLDWKARFSVREGLAETARWYRDFFRSHD